MTGAVVRARPALGVALVMLGAALVLADAAPLLAARTGRGVSLAVACRLALSRTCHQDPARTLAVGGVRLASCARCCGLHAGGLLAGVAVLLGMQAPAARARVVAAGAALLLAADGLTGALSPAWDHPLLRFATGVVFVAAVATAAVPHLADARRSALAVAG